MSECERPALVWIPPTLADPKAHFIVRRNASPVRVAIVGNERCLYDTGEELQKHALEHAWPPLLESVRSRGIAPVGVWTLIIIPKEVDWHEVLAEGVAADIDAHLEQNDNLTVLYVAELVDSAEVEAWSTAGLS